MSSCFQHRQIELWPIFQTNLGIPGNHVTPVGCDLDSNAVLGFNFEDIPGKQLGVLRPAPPGLSAKLDPLGVRPHHLRTDTECSIQPNWRSVCNCPSNSSPLQRLTHHGSSIYLKETNCPCLRLPTSFSQPAHNLIECLAHTARPKVQLHLDPNLKFWISCFRSGTLARLLTIPLSV